VPRIRLLILIPLLACAGQVQAQTAPENRWLLCGQPETLPPLPPLSGDPQAIYLTADHANLDPKGMSLLQGNVLLRRGDQQLRADQVHLDARSQQITATGEIMLRDSNLMLRSKSISYNLKSQEGSLGQTSYLYGPEHAHGQASEVKREGPGLTVLREASYTTCNPGHEDWLLTAGKVRLDQQSGTGTARNVVLRFKHVPILYTPWITFPIDSRRKSGLLPPSIGTSGNNGTEVRIPVYLNLAPNYDATVAAHYMGLRGTQLQTEFRYLTRHNRGSIYYEDLPQDQQTKTERSLLNFHDIGHYGSHFRSALIYNGASDSNYFQDFGTSLSLASTQFLERRADLTYQTSAWSLLTRAQAYQTVDSTILPADRPYQRLPQLLFQGGLPDQAGGLDYHLRTEWVQFVRPDSLQGSRLDVMPTISLPLSGSSWFFKPAVKYRYTGYQLDKPVSGYDTRTPNRSLFTSSLDTGLIFQRRAWGNTYQTLEPRLYYVYTPYVDQADLPVFDTGLAYFDFGQLFQDDRFIGADRVGDANRLTAALTTRLLSGSNGRELLHASIGQISYFSDRKVTLPDQTVEARARSNLAGELGAHFGDYWQASGSILWNPYTDQSEQGTARIGYDKDDAHIFNLAYRYLQNDFEQTDLSFIWPVTARWRTVGRWNYSLKDKRDLETLAGLQYDSCCWAVRIVARRYVTPTTGKYNDAVYLQLVLKGLGALGDNIDSVLKQGIQGYETNY
jgi:LPS-assembly protein